MRRFSIDLALHPDQTFELPPSLRHHLRVLRIGEGRSLEVLDGEGRLWSVRLTREGRRWSGQVVKALPTPASPSRTRSPGLVLAVAKTDAMSRAVRMATELGCPSMVLVPSERSQMGTRVNRTGLAALVERLERVSVEAARQSLRFDRPEIRCADGWGALLAELDAGAVADPTAAQSVLGSGARPPWLAIGNEGGWTPGELEQAVNAGWARLWLPGNQLRVETAVAVGLGLLSEVS
jgi:16S rRNA (uracil1498-N3)-methyltransferase